MGTIGFPNTIQKKYTMLWQPWKVVANEGYEQHLQEEKLDIQKKWTKLWDPWKVLANWGYDQHLVEENPCLTWGRHLQIKQLT